MRELARRVGAHRRIAVGALAAALCLGIGVPLAAGASRTGRAAASTRLLPCTGGPVVRPSSYVIACGDGNWYLTGLHWVRWSASVGIARAEVHLNDCTPSCAEGTFHAVSGVVVLSDPVRTTRYGSLYSVIAVLDDARLPGASGATTLQRLPLTASGR